MDSNPPSDHDLLISLQNGDQGALTELYDRHANIMFKVAYSILRNQTDAEDLVHDVVIEAWQRSDNYRPNRGSVRNWLLVRLRSRAIDRLRSVKVARNHGLVEKDNQISSLNDNAPLESVDQGRVRESLYELPENQRQIIELSYFQGLSCSEIAAQYDIPLGTVKSRLLAGVKKLRDLIVPQKSKANG